MRIGKGEAVTDFRFHGDELLKHNVEQSTYLQSGELNIQSSEIKNLGFTICKNKSAIAEKNSCSVDVFPKNAHAACYDYITRDTDARSEWFSTLKGYIFS